MIYTRYLIVPAREAGLKTTAYLPTGYRLRRLWGEGRVYEGGQEEVYRRLVVMPVFVQGG